MSGMKNSILNGNFRLEWNDEPHKVILNIGSKLPISSIIEMSGAKIQYVSLIDLDVIAQEFESSDCKKLFEAIDTTHTKQKVLFFGLLQDEFLATLNPEYE